MVWGTLILVRRLHSDDSALRALALLLGRPPAAPSAGSHRRADPEFRSGRILCGLAFPHRRAACRAVRRWISKMAAVAIYAALGAIYLRLVELPRNRKHPPRIIDVFDLLTYRERYEDLLARSGRDALTGALDRGRLEHLGRKRVEDATLAGRPLSLLIIDIDHFQELQRPLRPCRRRRRAATDRAHHRRGVAAERWCIPLRRRGIRGDRR